MREQTPTPDEHAVPHLVPGTGSVLSALGERRVGGSNHPHVLDGDTVWLVESGEIDVFAEVVEEGGAGHRIFLFRALAGTALFATEAEVSAESDATHLIAVGTSGSTMRCIAAAEFWSRCDDPVLAADLYQLIDAWVEALCGGITRGPAPSRCTEVAAGTDIVLEPRAAVRPSHAVAWVRQMSGRSHFLGKSALRIEDGALLPLSRKAWLVAPESARLLVADTPTIPAPAQLRQGLELLRRLALAALALNVRQAVELESERMFARERAQQAVMCAATDELSTTLQATRTGAIATVEAASDSPRIRSWDEALIAACQTIGNVLGLDVRPYPTGEGMPTPRDPVAAIAIASGLRTRKVALRDAWWEAEGGPLLGRTEAENHPVALLPTRRRGYQLVDPLHGTTKTLNAEVAATLSPFAQTFYRPLPEKHVTLRMLLRFGLHASRTDMLVVLAIAMSGALLGLVPAVVTSTFYNDIIPSADRGQLSQVTVLLITAALASACLSVTRSAAMLRIETRLSHSIQSALWDRLLSLPMSFFRQYAAGDLAVRAMSIDAMRQVVSGTTVTALIGGLLSLFNIALMFHYSARLAWWGIGAMAVAMSVTVAGGLLQLHHARAMQTVYARTSGLVLQLLSSVTKLRIAGAEPQAFRLWAERFADQRRLQFRIRRVAAVVATFSAALPLLASAALFYAAIPLLNVPEEPLRTGDFLAFLAAFSGGQAALLGASAAVLSALQLIPLYEQARPILTALPEVAASQADPGTLEGAIDIQHGVFRYDPDGPQILRDLTLRIEPGQFVAFVGPSGSGKSTILRLLLGFESLESGSIYFDGQDLEGLDVRSVRRQIGVVLQNGRLMSGDLFTNIAGASAATLDDAWEAVRLAGLEHDIRAMPMGMHTVVSDGGGSLSGGQRQRLMIARAIVQRPRILLLDEATSALDNRTQATVGDSLTRLNATRVVIAHRLSTIEHADRIFVIDKGRLVQQGTYTELLATPGLFADLAARQLN